MTATAFAPTTRTLVLNLSDRCDRCIAAAAVTVRMPSGNALLFCQHHANHNKARLIEQGATLRGSIAR